MAAVGSGLFENGTDETTIRVTRVVPERSASSFRLAGDHGGKARDAVRLRGDERRQRLRIGQFAQPDSVAQFGSISDQGARSSDGVQRRQGSRDHDDRLPGGKPGYRCGPWQDWGRWRLVAQEKKAPPAMSGLTR